VVSLDPAQAAVWYFPAPQAEHGVHTVFVVAVQAAV
jgi:hypothetical protein